MKRKDIEGHRRYFLLNDNSSFNIKEAYKAIRTNMLSVLSICEGPKIAAFTSAEPGDGKTGSCANIAVAFSQMGAKHLQTVLYACSGKAPSSASVTNGAHARGNISASGA